MPPMIPALFPPLFGAVALGLLWQSHGVPLIGWAVILIWAVVLVGYLMRIARAPTILSRDLDTLPGRTGTVAANLTLILVAGAFAPVVPLIGQVLLGASLLIQLALIAAFFRRISKDRNVRAVQPVWQMIFTGFVVAAAPAAALGALPLAQILLGLSVGTAVLLWGLTLMQFQKRRFPPPQLRPALAIHLSPAAMAGLGALACGYPGLADTFFWMSALIFAALIARLRWLTEHGFSPFWSAFTFPLVGFTALTFAIYPTLGWPLIVLASLVVIYVCARIFTLWRSGRLADLTFAAI